VRCTLGPLPPLDPPSSVSPGSSSVLSIVSGEELLRRRRRLIVVGGSSGWGVPWRTLDEAKGLVEVDWLRIEGGARWAESSRDVGSLEEVEVSRWSEVIGDCIFRGRSSARTTQRAQPLFTQRFEQSNRLLTGLDQAHRVKPRVDRLCRLKTARSVCSTLP
jgi:hypothetical protein